MLGAVGHDAMGQRLPQKANFLDCISLMRMLIPAEAIVTDLARWLSPSITYLHIEYLDAFLTDLIFVVLCYFIFYPFLFITR